MILELMIWSSGNKRLSLLRKLRKNLEAIFKQRLEIIFLGRITVEKIEKL